MTFVIDRIRSLSALNFLKGRYAVSEGESAPIVGSVACNRWFPRR
jgi:hypothetical protein